MKPTRKIWKLEHPSKKLAVEVSLHAEGQEYTPGGKGIYCYYLYIYESQVTPEQFSELWLKDEVTRWSPESPERITHDYYSLPILKAVELNGGITYYAKHGQVEGHRSVQIGCDYNHSWDSMNPPPLEKVIGDALRTADEAAAYLNATEPLDP